MEWMVAACDAGLTVAAAWLSIQKTWSEPVSRQKKALVLLAAALGGAASGWLLVQRVGLYLPNLLRILLLGVALAAAASVDIQTHRIPNPIVLGIAAIYAGCSALDLLLSGADAVPMMLNGLVSAVVFFGVFFLLRAASRGGIGYGDIKLITAAALILGVYGTFGFLLFSHVLAAVAAVVLLLMKKATRKDGLPFGPFFYLGYLLMILTGSF